MFDPISKVFGSLLGFIFGVVGNYGIAIIFLTIIIKSILIPLSIAQIKQTNKMNEVQPKLKELQAKYKNDKEALNAKTMELYSTHKMNPLSGCLPMLIQFPILIGLYTTLRNPLEFVFSGNQKLTSAALGQGFLWISNLADPDVLSNVFNSSSAFVNSLPGILPILAAVSTYFQMSTMNSSGQQNSQMKTMATMMPIMILVMGRSLSGGLILYWTVSNIFQMIQQTIINKLTGEESKKDVLN